MGDDPQASGGFGTTQRTAAFARQAPGAGALLSLQCESGRNPGLRTVPETTLAATLREPAGACHQSVIFVEAYSEGLCLPSEPSQPDPQRAERRRILVDWNRYRNGRSHRTTLSRLFERQVDQTPGAKAAAFGTQCLTYRELNERANRLAHYLAARGVGPEVRVGVCLDRSLDLLVGLLGVLKAGGAYVPLDPSYPADRLGLHPRRCGRPGADYSGDSPREPSVIPGEERLRRFWLERNCGVL